MGCSWLVDWQRVVCKSEQHTSTHNINARLTVLQTLLLPTVFSALGPNTLHLFGAVNILSIIVVWALYPETNQRTLEEMNLVFAADSIWNWYGMTGENSPCLSHC